MISTEDIKSALILANTLSELLGQTKGKPKVTIASAPTASGGGGGTPSDTVVTEKSYGQSEAAGSATTYSRGDHTHGTPAAGGGGSLVVTTTDQTANREFNTIYQNTTGKPMLVVFDVWCGVETTIRFNIGASSPPTLLVFDMGNYGVEATHEASILVPPNWYYNIIRDEEAYIQHWIEQTLEIV